jgi:hypothetical protein
MKRITSMMAASLAAVLVAGGASEARLHAQIGPGEIFTVPFAFTADGRQIQPGTYEIRRGSSQFLMSIENVNTGEKQLFSVRPEERSAAPRKGLLVFQGCGDRKELSEFHVRGSNLFSATIDSGRRTTPEVEDCSRIDTVTVAAR